MGTLDIDREFSESAMAAFKRSLEAQLRLAAEPLIAQAMQKAEQEMRERVGAVVTRIVSGADFQMAGHRIVISVDFNNLGGK